MAPTTRTKNGSTNRLSISSDFKAKKIIAKKKKKIVIPRFVGLRI
jgi:hypothetical protein